jgi:ABC-type lipoprotein export system ATPase subunit
MLIDCKHVTKQYVSDGKELTAVDDATFSINSGEFVVILGHSGSGKTTLLSLIGGLTSPEKGDIVIGGVHNWQQSDKDLSKMRNKTIGFIFQFASLIPSLTVIENMLLPLTFGRGSSVSMQEAEELLDKIGLLNKKNVFPAQLSGGQQRRVAIARAFMNNPDIILADEPTGDLDEETEGEILDLFREYNERGTTFVVVTHNRYLGRSQNNPRVLTMRNGHVSEGIDDRSVTKVKV